MNQDYIEFRHGNGCYSLAGRNGQGQEIVLDPRCGEKHTLIHEVISVYTYIILLSNPHYSFQILHALGLLHEHQRPDRDDYIEIDTAAVARTGAFKQFQKASFQGNKKLKNESQKFKLKTLYKLQILLKANKFNWTSTDILTEYDVKSIMHYDGTLRGYFSKPIMTDKNGKSIEVNREMSFLDIQKLNKMYPCKSESVCGKF